MRHLITPPPGVALAGLDYRAQEIAIAAARSGDEALIAAYNAVDVYLAAAGQAGLLTGDEDDATRAAIRAKFKTVLLGVDYGMEAQTMATRLGCTVSEAEALIARHRATYRQFWRWIRKVVREARSSGTIATALGWRMRVLESAKTPTLMNWRMQAGGAEILRVAVGLADKDGLALLAPVHDSLWLEAPEAEIDAHVERLRSAMVEAGRIVLGDALELRVEVTILRPGEHYRCGANGCAMWQWLMAELAEAEAGQ